MNREGKSFKKEALAIGMFSLVLFLFFLSSSKNEHQETAEIEKYRHEVKKKNQSINKFRRPSSSKVENFVEFKEIPKKESKSSRSENLSLDEIDSDSDHKNENISNNRSSVGATGLHNRTIIRETNLNTGYTTYIAGQNADQLPRTPDFPFDQLPCEEGPGYNCNFNLGTGVYTRASTFHTPSNSWLFFDFQNTLNLIKSNGTNGSIIYFDTLPDTIQSMLWRNDILYYCSEEGELRKRNYSNYPDYVETVLHFPGQGILCAGKRILWKNASGDKPDRLVFPFVQNGLMGVAEYWNP